MRKIKNLPIMTGDFGTSTSVIYRMRRQKKRNSNIKDLNHIINDLALTDIFRIYNFATRLGGNGF